MGGQIKVILRKEDGEVKKVSGWTNSMPYFVKNIKFFKKDKNWIESYLDLLEVDNNKSDLSPISYGIVLFDFKNNTIVSTQNYCSFNSFHDSGISIDKSRFDKGKDKNPDWNSYVASKELLEKGFLDIKKIIYNKKNFNEKDEVRHNLDIDGVANFSKEDVKMSMLPYFIKKMIPNNYGVLLEIFINFEKLGWKCYDYGTDSDGVTKAFKKIHELGLEFSDDEIEGWESFVSSRVESESEDDDYIETVNPGFLKTYLRNKKVDKLIGNQ